MTQCNDTHDLVIYEGNECPVCKVRLQMDQVLDRRSDIEIGDILQQDRQISYLTKELARTQRYVGLKPRKHRFLWLFPKNPYTDNTDF